MKEGITGKTKNTNDSFPRKILINNTEILKKEQIAKSLTNQGRSQDFQRGS